MATAQNPYAVGKTGANPYLQQPQRQLAPNLGFGQPPAQQQQPLTQPMQGGWQASGSSQSTQGTGMSNPYLGAQAGAIQQQANQNLTQNLLPAVNSGAVAAGGYGGSRQGIAQGLAMGQTQQGVSNALAGLYGNAYAQDQQLKNQWDIAGLNNSTALQQAQIAADASRYGSDNSARASMYGADKSSAASMYGSDKSAMASMYGADKSSAATMAAAASAAAASMYGADKSSAASMYNSDNTVKIAGMNNATTQRGQDQSYNLGLGNLGLGYGQLANQQQQTANQYNLGLGNLDLGYLNAANQYGLGLGNLGLGYLNAQNNYQLGLGQNQIGQQDRKSVV